MCSNCDKVAVCKVYDTLVKFDVEAKKPLGVDITMNKCINIPLILKKRMINYSTKF